MKQLGCRTTTDNINLVKNNQMIVLGTMAQTVPGILREIAPFVTKDHLLLSFVGGESEIEN